MDAIWALESFMDYCDSEYEIANEGEKWDAFKNFVLKIIDNIIAMFQNLAVKISSIKNVEVSKKYLDNSRRCGVELFRNIIDLSQDFQNGEDNAEEYRQALARVQGQFKSMQGKKFEGELIVIEKDKKREIVSAIQKARKMMITAKQDLRSIDRTGSQGDKNMLSVLQAIASEIVLIYTDLFAGKKSSRPDGAADKDGRIELEQPINAHL